MVRENKGLTVRGELEIIDTDEYENSDFGFPIFPQDGSGITRAFLYNDNFFDNYIGTSSPPYDLSD